MDLKWYVNGIALAIMAGISNAQAQLAPLKSQVEMIVTLEGKDRSVVIELDEVNAPKTCQNFRKLCREGFFEGTLFHRVIPGYIVQAGDPFSKEPAKKGLWGTGGPGYTIAPELGKPHLRGSVAMARLGDAVNPGKESSGSQFYVALDRIESLDGEYTVFAQVVSGLETMDQIGKAAADRTNVPVDKIVIKKMNILGGNQENAIAPAPVTKTEVSEPAPEPVPLPEPPVEKLVNTPAPVPPPTNPAPENEIRDITPRRTPAPPANQIPPNSGAPGGSEQPKPVKPPKKKGGFAKFIERFW